MSSMTNQFENELALLIFNNDAITLIGDAGGILGSSADGTLYLSLHTASPGETGGQTTNECAYTSYARVGLARTTGGWTVTNDVATPQADVAFPACTGGTETATHVGIGTASSGGAGKLLLFGALSPNISISTGVTPRLVAATTTITFA